MGPAPGLCRMSLRPWNRQPKKLIISYFSWARYGADLVSVAGFEPAMLEMDFYFPTFRLIPVVFSFVASYFPNGS